MTPHISQPCACGDQRIPYLSNVIVDEAGESHYRSYCAGQRIELKPDAAPSKPWTVLAFTCEHGEARIATGPDPEQAVRDLGCCDKAEVA